MDSSFQSGATMRVLLIDDHAIFRQGLSMLLSQLNSELAIAQLTGPRMLPVFLAQDPGPRPDLAILDLHMPDFEGIAALAFFRAQAPDIPVVVLTGDEQPDTVKACIDLGACGYVPKSADAEVLTEAMSRILAGGVWLPGSSLRVVSQDTTPAQPLPSGWAGCRVHVTARQREVLQRVVQGKTNKVIGRELGISDGTVKTHLAHLMALLGVSTRTQLVYELARRGLKVDDLPLGP